MFPFDPPENIRKPLVQDAVTNFFPKNMSYLGIGNPYGHDNKILRPSASFQNGLSHSCSSTGFYTKSKTVEGCHEM